MLPIRFQGLSLNKDEQSVQNGELALCANMELHDAAIRPSVLTGTKIDNPLTVPSSDGSSSVANLIYVHKTAAYTHFIGLLNNQLHWFLADGSYGGTLSQTFSGGIKAIDSIGNTLIVVSTDGVHYILWRNTDTAYKYLGQKPPYLNIEFGLSANYSDNYELGGITTDSDSDTGFNCAYQQTTLECSEALTAVSRSSTINKGDTLFRIKTDAQSTITENLWALINRTNNKIARAGHFYANFYVRYCYRLYDGSMILHSAPIFMSVLVPDNFYVKVANTYLTANDEAKYEDGNLTVNRKDAEGNSYSFKISKLTFVYYPRNVALNYTIANADTVSQLKEWADIVTSVDVFITPPILRTDSSQLFYQCVYEPEHYYNDGIWQLSWTLGLASGTYNCYTTVHFPGLSNSAYADKIANQASFYRVYSFRIDDIAASSDIKLLPVDTSVIENVATQELMVDDYKSHNYILPAGLYVYNHRANFYGLSERLFQGFTHTQFFCRGRYLKNDGNLKISKIVVRLNTTDGYKHVSVDSSGVSGLDTDTYFLYNMPKFYPDARADRMYVYFYNSDTATYAWAEFRLTACNELNGAIHVGTFSTDYPTVDEPSYTVDDIVEMASTIYTSEQNNPFYFPVEAINSVGTARIIGLAATTRALSQGQFGQYPLMAFTADGIWALQVASTGTYSSMQPISREVCVNPDSICQLDQSVVFATDRALCKVVESSVAAFSAILDGPFFSVASCLAELYQYFSSGSHADSNIIQLIEFSTPPIEYFKTGRVLYDFVNSRLVVLPATAADTASEVALVYSIRDDAWSTMLVSTPLAVINAYPYPYIQQHDGSVLALDQKYDYTSTTLHSGLIITRTLSFDQTMLAITGFDQLADAAVPPTVFLFGSNDNRSWHYIGRSARHLAQRLPAHPFRFFRLALHLNMTQAEQYYQINLDVTTKYHKL